MGSLFHQALRITALINALEEGRAAGVPAGVQERA